MSGTTISRYSHRMGSSARLGSCASCSSPSCMAIRSAPGRPAINRCTVAIQNCSIAGCPPPECGVGHQGQTGEAAPGRAAPGGMVPRCGRGPGGRTTAASPTMPPAPAAVTGMVRGAQQRFDQQPAQRAVVDNQTRGELGSQPGEGGSGAERQCTHRAMANRPASHPVPGAAGAPR